MNHNIFPYTFLIILLLQVNIELPAQKAFVYCNKTIDEKKARLLSKLNERTDILKLNVDSLSPNSTSFLNIKDSLQEVELLDEVQEIFDYKERINFDDWKNIIKRDNKSDLYEDSDNILQRFDAFYFRKLLSQYSINGQILDFESVYGNIGAAEIFEDSKGKLWFKSGILSGSQQLEAGHLFTYDNDKIRFTLSEKSASEISVKAFLGKRDNLWILHRMGFSWFDGKKWNTHSEKDIEFLNGELFQDSKGTVYVFSEQNKIFVINDSLRIFETKEDLKDLTLRFGWYPDKSLRFVELNDKLWVLIGKKVMMFNGKSWYTYSSKDGLPCKRIYDMLYDERNHDIFVGGNCGLYRLSKNNTWKKIPLVKEKNVVKLYSDNNDRFWIFTGEYGKKGTVLATENGNFEFSLPGKSLSYLLVEGPTVYEDNFERIWFTNNNSVLLNYGNGSFSENYAKSIGLNQKGIGLNTFVEDHEGIMWVLVNKQIYFYDNNGEWKNDLSIKTIREDSDIFLEKDNQGNLWMVTKEIDQNLTNWVFRQRNNGNWRHIFSISPLSLR